MTSPQQIFYPILSATQDDYKIPVVRTSMRDLNRIVTNALNEIIRPFYSEGKGQILCPVCVGSCSVDGRLRPSLHSRSSYAEHFVCHLPVFGRPMPFISLQETYRLLEGNKLYTFILAYNGESPEGDRPDECPFNEFSEDHFDYYADLRQLLNPNAPSILFEDSLAASARFFDGRSTTESVLTAPSVPTSENVPTAQSVPAAQNVLQTAPPAVAQGVIISSQERVPKNGAASADHEADDHEADDHEADDHEADDHEADDHEADDH
jgi:hypothetical protein